MPRGDRTGPRGMGPMTGRAAGYCVGNEVPGYGNPVAGRGFGRGFGRDRGFGGGGRGWRNMFYATGLEDPRRGGQPGWMGYGGYAAPVADPELEKQALKNQAAAMQNELDVIRKRLEEMEKVEDSK